MFARPVAQESLRTSECELAAEVVESEGLSDLAINLCKRHSRAWPSNIDAWANMEFW